MSTDPKDFIESLPPLELEFDPPTFAEWQAAVVASNQDRPFERLVTETIEGISLQPMYEQAAVSHIDAVHTLPGRNPFRRGATSDGYLIKPWLVAQEIGYPTPQLTNEALRYDLARGQSANALVLDGQTRAGRDPDDSQANLVGAGGLSLAVVPDFLKTLAGIDLNAWPLHLPVGAAALPLFTLLVAAVKAQGEEPSILHGRLDFDPLGLLAQAGTLPFTLAGAYDEMALIDHWTTAHAPGLRVATVHTLPYHDAGADAVQELAYAIATGVAYVRAMAERGIPPAEFIPRLQFEFVADADFFMTIAKLRAARQLWDQVTAAFVGGDSTHAMALHARTARRNKTVVDPYTNMLRVTTEALAAVVAGVESLHISPFDEPLGPSSEFGRRIARNVHIILRDEAKLRHLLDPGGGSGAVESLTSQLGAAAWTVFQEIEAQGGMAEALLQGTIQDALARTAARRAEDLARRRRVLVGINQFAVTDEEPVPQSGPDMAALQRQRLAELEQFRASRPDVANDLQELRRQVQVPAVDIDGLFSAAIAAAASGATLGELMATLHPAGGETSAVIPLASQRLSAPFEALRVAARQYQEKTGHPPQVFLATMGPLRQHKARADFSQDYLHAGGFATTGGRSYETPEEAVAAWQEAPTPAVVICSTDDTYPDLVPPLVAQIKAIDAETRVILAGYPKDQIAAHEAAGIDHFIYLGADCLATNQWLMNIYSERVA